LSENAHRERHSGRWLLLVPAVIVLALVANGINPSADRAKLYFLDSGRTKLAAERRAMPLVGPVEERAERVLKELLLGPFDYRLQPLFLQDARLGPVMHRGGRLIVELQIADLGQVDAPFALLRSAIEKTLSASVPGCGKLDLYINGRQAFSR
jgi:hypothetical protein